MGKIASWRSNETLSAIDGLVSLHRIPQQYLLCADRESNPGYELGKLMSYH